MIREDKYNEILNSGLILDHYFVLSNIKNGIEPIKNKRIQGFINLLEKKGYLEEGVLTEKSLELVEEFETSVVEPSPEVSKKQEDFAIWIQNLHLRCQEKLLQLTGSKQVRDKIDKKSYPFLPNSIDLGKVLYRVISLYKIKDYERIEKCIMNYIEKCAAANNWFPILQYYIMKNNKSNLVTDCEGSDEPVQEVKSSQKFV
jgi:hypothetical protein